MFEKYPPVSSYINTQIHMSEYFTKNITSKEKNDFFDLIQEYTNNTPIKEVDQMLYSWAIQYNNDDLINQSYFHPYPLELNNVAEQGI